MSKEARFLMCLDYGAAKVGVAVGSLVPVTPLDVIRYSSREQLVREVLNVIDVEKPEGIVLGWPEDRLSIETETTEKIKRFGTELGRLTGLPIVYYPETLTTQQATKRMIEAGIPQKKRRVMEDSFAAAIILDNYLQSIE